MDYFLTCLRHYTSLVISQHWPTGRLGAVRYQASDWVNSLRPSDAICRHRSGTTLAQVMAFIRYISATIHLNQLINYVPDIYFKSLRGEWVNVDRVKWRHMGYNEQCTMNLMMQCLYYVKGKQCSFSDKRLSPLHFYHLINIDMVICFVYWLLPCVLVKRNWELHRKIYTWPRLIFTGHTAP